MDRHTIIIAEAGVNYNGDINIAKSMVEVAAKAGADIVKFQTGIPEKTISVFAEKADYQKVNTHDLKGEESQLDMARQLMLPWDVYPELIKHCQKNNIEFLSTPFDEESAAFLHELGMRLWKIPSGEITNLPLLRFIASYHEPVILSTGMCTLQEIDEALHVLRPDGNRSDITVLQCNTEYPTPYEDANLNAMKTISAQLGVKTGYSDHTSGYEVPLAAVALGAEIIEKHFTLDRNMKGPDQIVSIEPDELEQMVSSIRNIEKALGTGTKMPSASEVKNMKIARKSIVALKAIQEGEVFSAANIASKRPGNGISPMKWDIIIGKKAKRAYKPDEMLDLDEMN